jgi:fatty acid desaturase
LSLLAHRADRRTVAYMAVASGVAVAHWNADSFNPALFAAGIVLGLAVAIMNHNHSHRPLWRAKPFNRLTDYWFTIFQGHPGFVFEPMHVAYHHRLHNGPGDPTCTDRIRAGNDLAGLLLHPFDFARVAAPHIAAHLRRLWREDRAQLRWVASHYGALLAVDGAALAADAPRALYCVLAPQAAALWFLLASNYLQHAQTGGGSEFGHSRNFTGLINAFFFNIGYHTAHHHFGDMHWSELADAHARIRARIPASLNEKSFIWYCARVFLLRRS